MKKLIVTGLHKGRQVLDIDRSRVIIGRAAGSDLQLNTPLTSRLHALLSVMEDGVYVSDLGSLNGTYVNGRKVDWAPVQDHDVIRIGDCRIRVVGSTAANEVPVMSEPARLWPVR